MNPIKIEIGQYREVNKGALKASFSVVIYPEGQKILDCRYFVSGDSAWFSFPQKEIKYADGRKTEYLPYISYINKEYQEQLKIAILAALKQAKPQENYAKKDNSYQGQAHSLPHQTSSPQEQLPF